MSKRVVAMSDLTPAQRRLVRALAKMAEAGPDPKAKP